MLIVFKPPPPLQRCRRYFVFGLQVFANSDLDTHSDYTVLVARWVKNEKATERTVIEQ